MKFPNMYADGSHFLCTIPCTLLSFSCSDTFPEGNVFIFWLTYREEGFIMLPSLVPSPSHGPFPLMWFPSHFFFPGLCM